MNFSASEAQMIEKSFTGRGKKGKNSVVPSL